MPYIYRQWCIEQEMKKKEADKAPVSIPKAQKAEKVEAPKVEAKKPKNSPRRKAKA